MAAPPTAVLPGGGPQTTGPVKWVALVVVLEELGIICLIEVGVLPRGGGMGTANGVGCPAAGAGASSEVDAV